MERGSLGTILEAGALEEAGMPSRQEMEEEQVGGGWEKWADVRFLVREEWPPAVGGERRSTSRLAGSTWWAMVPTGKDGVWATHWLCGDVCGRHGGADAKDQPGDPSTLRGAFAVPHPSSGPRILLLWLQPRCPSHGALAGTPDGGKVPPNDAEATWS